jgi:hypothetical protein
VADPLGWRFRLTKFEQWAILTLPGKISIAEGYEKRGRNLKVPAALDFWFSGDWRWRSG